MLSPLLLIFFDSGMEHLLPYFLCALFPALPVKYFTLYLQNLSAKSDSLTLCDAFPSEGNEFGTRIGERFKGCKCYLHGKQVILLPLTLSYLNSSE